MGLLDKLLGRNKKRSAADEALAILPETARFAAEKWTYFLGAVPFEDSVSLKEKINTFCVPAMEGLKNNFVVLQSASPSMFLLIIAQGVELSGAHSRKEIEEALETTLPPLGR